MSGWLNTFQVVTIPQIGVGGPAGKGPEPDCSWCGEPMSVGSVAFVPLWYEAQTGNQAPMSCASGRCQQAGSAIVPESRMHIVCAHAMIDAMAKHVASGTDKDFSWTTGEFLCGSNERWER